MGLGLTMSKAISERLGGDISLRSEEGKGSTFTFNIKFEREQSLEVLEERK